MWVETCCHILTSSVIFINGCVDDNYVLMSNSIANIRSFIHFGSIYKHYDHLTSQVICTIRVE